MNKEKFSGIDTDEHARQDYTPKFEGPLEYLMDLAACNQAGLPNTHGATPLDKLSTMHQQIDLLEELSFPLQFPPHDVPVNINEFVRETFKDRFLARGEANDENYRTSLLPVSYYANNHQAMHLIDRAEQGLASPAELILVRDMLGIRSVELACLTHPYGRRIDPGLKDMRSAVRSGVLLMGGEYYDDPEPKFRIKQIILDDVPVEKRHEVYSKSDQEQLKVAHQYGGVAGILITRKRTLGMMNDGTIIKERSSFILRADPESYVMQQDLDQLMAYDDAQWHDRAIENTPLKGIILKLLEDDEYSHAIPISTTIYAHNKETEAQVTAKEEARKSARQEYLNAEGTNDYIIQEQLEKLRWLAPEGSYQTRSVQMIGQMMIVGGEGYDEDKSDNAI